MTLSTLHNESLIYIVFTLLVLGMMKAFRNQVAMPKSLHSFAQQTWLNNATYYATGIDLNIML